VGDIADATGFPVVRNGFLTLDQAELKDTHIFAPVQPFVTTPAVLAQSHHIFDLVTIEGRVVTEVRVGTQDEYIIATDGGLFSALLAHSGFLEAGEPLPTMKNIPIGARVRVTGICSNGDANPYAYQISYSILMRGYDDIEVVAQPSLLNVHNLLMVVSALLAIVLGVSFLGLILARKVARQRDLMAARIAAEAARERWLAQIEHRRGSILEAINGSEPLARILEEIAEMVTFWLDGAPCWCVIAEGAQLGRRPAPESGLRTVQIEITGRANTALGTVFAALPAQSKPTAAEQDALSMATRLAALAIETRRLYSDLLHRSEFDLLTDTHNRFSLNRALDACILEARHMASIFGLVYIDLDDFKQINDRYGHLVGDLYLQEVSHRLKKLLRSHDMVARLGGDEFALLLPDVHSREDVLEVCHRIEHCFEHPLLIEGLSLDAGASTGIALYPEDGATRDDLLRVADEAMYESKKARRAARMAAGAPAVTGKS
jgi:diguanylate cyclase (GGDEF)-like protein